jgi:hypothetical protein
MDRCREFSRKELAPHESLRDVECQLNKGLHPDNYIHDRKYRVPSVTDSEFDGIISYGIIAFTIVEEEELSYENDVSAIYNKKKPSWRTCINEIKNTRRVAKFLICESRDNFEYIDFIRGTWKTRAKLEYYFTLFTPAERERIRTHTFDALWDDLWVDHNFKIYSEGITRARNKYIQIQDQIPDILRKTVSTVQTPPWGFPKGKKKTSLEDPVVCGVREFCEETRISHTYIIKKFGDKEYVEEFQGTNDKLYRTHYFLAQLSTAVYPKKMSTPYCIRKSTISEEVAEVRWVGLEEASHYLNKRRHEMLVEVYNDIVAEIESM